MRDDATIHRIFDKQDSDKEEDVAKNSDDDMAPEHAAMLRLQTIANDQLVTELKSAQEGDPNAIKITDNLGELAAENNPAT